VTVTIAVDPSTHDIHVADAPDLSVGNRVEGYSADGTLLMAIGSEGTANGQFVYVGSRGGPCQPVRLGR
jgi:hypothetical protein